MISTKKAEEPKFTRIEVAKVLGFKEELVHVLQGLDDYTVKNARVNYTIESDEIARLLDVESVLSGSLRRSGDTLRINYRISTGGEVVQGVAIEGKVENLFELQEDLAAEVRQNIMAVRCGPTIALVGRYSSGKSTFVNALAGRRHLPARARPTTAVMVFLHSSDAGRVVVVPRTHEQRVQDAE